jgi:hypothetical protein
MKQEPKQTAVEWLYETLWKQTDFSLPNNILEQAKEMEKQQIMDAWDNGCEDDGIIDNAEQYYNETFKNK